MEFLERFEILEMSIDHVQVFASTICGPASHVRIFFILCLLLLLAYPSPQLPVGGHFLGATHVVSPSVGPSSK